MSPRDRTVSAIIAGILFLSCTVVFPMKSFGEMQMTVFSLAVFLGLAAVMWLVNKWFSLFMVLCIVSIVKNSTYAVGTAFIQVPRLSEQSLSAVTSIGFAAIWYLIIVKSVRNVDAMLTAICCLALANVLYQGVQWMRWDFIMTPKIGAPDNIWYNPLVGFMGNRNHTSALLAMCFPAFLRRRWLWGIPFVIFGLWMAKSMGGITALIIGMVFYGLLFYRQDIRYQIALVFSVAVIGFVMVKTLGRGADFGGRLTAWHNAITLYKQNWLLGCGIGNWAPMFSIVDLHKGMRWTHAHNEYLQTMFEISVGFPLILGGYVAKLTERFHVKQAVIPLTAVVIIAVNAFYNFPFHIPQTALVAITWMAILEVKCIRSAQ